MMQVVLKRRTVYVFALCVCFYTIYQILINSHRNRVFKDLSSETTRSWFNKQLADEDLKRVGLGEHGADVSLTDPEEIMRNAKLYEETGFSVVVSDKISVNRSLPVVVHSDCDNIKYSTNLPNVSVVIIYHNEVQSVLLRTVHSVINRTPSELLHEVILVNDNSSREDLYQPLNDYVMKNFPSKVKIKNLTERRGLIVARMEGARMATGEVLVFFDAHVEVHFNWLAPLLQPIMENRKIATLPIVDYFDAFTFGYYPEQEKFQGSRGIIDWYLDFHELPKLAKDTEDNLKMFPNPIMLGCAFAIDRRFFLYELGGYDEGLQIWNGENYELSFKLWMCANGMFTVPCSRVAHSFRQINPSRKRSDDYVAKNFMRISEVWLDEFKTLPKQLEPERYAKIDAGDLTRQKSLREKLKCKSFLWFLTQVAHDMIQMYPPLVELPTFASGAVQSVANPRLCFDNLGELSGEKLGLMECLEDPGVNQRFVYSFYKDIRQIHGRRKFCLDLWNLQMDHCNQLPYGNQFWIYNKVSKNIYIESPDKKCLTHQLNNDTLTLTNCIGEMNQEWRFAYINETAFQSFNDIFGYG